MVMIPYCDIEFLFYFKLLVFIEMISAYKCTIIIINDNIKWNLTQDI